MTVPSVRLRAIVPRSQPNSCSSGVTNRPKTGLSENADRLATNTTATTAQP